jgi:hypothetical protein
MPTGPKAFTSAAIPTRRNSAGVAVLPSIGSIGFIVLILLLCGACLCVLPATSTDQPCNTGTVQVQIAIECVAVNGTEG